ncbi:protein kinase domain-containing protein [Gordonia sp. DT30]|uniref:protein kinase domain-containing protein n=1 Tax=Gordonia sp. DT30 TaxID=3416546 RepID=UPI003CEB092C
MPLSPGSQVAGYKVISLLGSGGMGEVYLVENPTLLRREALKVISLAGAHDPDFQKRFTNEARTTAALDHPSIISIHQYGINEDGTPWFTMNHLEGADLTHGAVSAADTAALTARVADALDYAHRRNIIHRDVKPANIFVSRDERGQIDRVTVLDFGIAKLVNSTSLTATSAFIGTLAYCAPEVIEGHDAGAASDQYSLACTVFQLLTGQAPFTTTSPSALVMAHLTKQISPISSLRPDLARLDPVLQKALAKNPTDRYPDCRSFATALRQALESHGGAASAPRPGGPGAVGAAGALGAPNRPYSQPTVPPPYGPGAPSYAPQSTPAPAYPGPAPHTPAPHTPGPQTPGPQTPGPQTPAPAFGGFAPPGPTVASNPSPQANSSYPQSPPGAAYPGNQAGQPPAYPPSQPNHLLGGGYPPPGPAGAPKKKHTGLIVGVIAAVVVVVVVLGVGIAFATGAFSNDEPSAPTAHPGILAVSGNSSCGITNAQLYCWGGNYDGQLGNGTETASSSPVKVDLPNVTAVSLGGYTNTDKKLVTTACAVSDGSAYCWGANKFGQIGNGSTTDTQSPVKVTGLSGRVTAIATGYGSTCAIADGKLSCWGDNDDGQVGVESITDQTATPTAVPGISGNVTAVAAAQGTTCAVADTVYCWGNNDSGQLGTGATTRANTPQKVALTGADSISVGSYSITDQPDQYTTVCASASGKGYCWGDNRYGQVGDGTKESRHTPTPVTGLGTVSQINTGWGSTCAVSDSKLFCWGDNEGQQLGTGAGDGTTKPTQVTALPGSVEAVYTGLGTTCSLVDESSLYCWGRNAAGQVGNGSSGEDQKVSSPTLLNLPA